MHSTAKRRCSSVPGIAS
ncbi:hypothetical protein YPPY66_1384, partial [Yersinia pestis PY-66]